jgi:hypothetical protein
MYPFILNTQKRDYTYNCVTKDERDHWVRIFNLISDMNKKGISICVTPNQDSNVIQLNPHVYENQQKRQN